MYNRNEGVRNLIKAEKSADWNFTGAKFNLRTGKITHNQEGSIQFGADWLHLVEGCYPIFNENNEYVEYMVYGQRKSRID